MQRKQTERREKLEAALEAKGIELRADSSLCQKFIEGAHDAWPLAETVKRMVEMHVLYEHTDYESRLDYDSVREEADAYGDRGAFPELWADHKEQAEVEAMDHLRARTAQGGPEVASAAVCRCGRKLNKHLL